MKRTLGAALVLVVGLVLAPLFASSPVSASVNDFYIDTYDIHYDLATTEDNHSLLTTTETITAVFPYTNQNHGLERAIPRTYKDQDLRLAIKSVTDDSGNTLEYRELISGDVSTLRIGSADTYVHGRQTYKIIYTQQDVTHTYTDTNAEEWYWDTNGTEWQVSINQLDITAKIDNTLAQKLTKDPICYFGTQGSDGGDNTNATLDCAVESTNPGVYTTSASNLTAGQNITVAFAFPTNTFAAYVAPPINWWALLLIVWVPLTVLTGFMAMLFGVGIFVAVSNRSNRKKELKPIPVQYIPPQGASVTTSAAVYAAVLYSPFAAQLIDFAVRHYIAIIETKAKTFWSPAQYDIEILKDVHDLLEEEQEVLSDMFGATPGVGARLALKDLQSNVAYVVRTQDNTKKLKALIEGRYGLKEPSEELKKFVKKWAIATLVLGIILLSPGFLLLSLVLFISSHFTKRLTDKGLELRRYIFGLKEYISSSEKDRLAFLQGPDTAEKVGYAVDVNDKGQIVKLYERTLPYAILFNAEKEWSKRLGDFYQDSQSNPDWYRGSTSNSVFNAVAFSAVISSFSTSASASSGYTAGSSSSSGGSGGGGFSGGGGGGGGGGGW